MLKHSPVLAQDLRVGDSLTSQSSLSLELVRLVQSWPGDSTVLVESWANTGSGDSQLRTHYFQADELVWIEDSEGEPHPLTSPPSVSVNRSDLLKVLALAECVDDVTDDEGDALARVEHAAYHVE